MQEYGASQVALPMVAMTEGAQAIRARLLAIFGVAITLILDWDHLEKKTKELMSMIAKNFTTIHFFSAKW